MSRKVRAEHLVLDDVRAVFDDAGWYGFKTHGNAVRRSLPDLLGCLDGITLAVEVKREGEDPRPDQVAELRRWARAGAVTGVARSADDARRFVAEVRRRAREGTGR